jgi:tRNA-specific 2-thiouridylase
VAMSGGVDSSVAAALLKDEGHKVIGMTMNLFSLPREICASENLRSCCGWKAQEDAHRVAVALGIPHFVADFRRPFERKVIDDFVREYRNGRTPNPCIRCNQFIKFTLLYERARRLGAELIATGHYARAEKDRGSGRWLLKKGVDSVKDQSYFLYPLTQVELGRTLFPVGRYTKGEIRRLAGRYELPVAQKPESQEICFVPNNDYAAFLRERVPEAFRPGPILDLRGRLIGEHRGIISYTLGQRRRMGISAPHPLYVVAIDPHRNVIIAGKAEDLLKRRLIVSDLNWISIERLKRRRTIRAKIRYKHDEAEATISPEGSGAVLLEFERPQRAATPGQAAVFYEGDLVVGGGTIRSILD